MAKVPICWLIGNLCLTGKFTLHKKIKHLEILAIQRSTNKKSQEIYLLIKKNENYEKKKTVISNTLVPPQVGLESPNKSRGIYWDEYNIESIFIKFV